MTLFIPLGNGSPYGDQELRFALRSWQKHSPPDRVIIIGHKPSWLVNVEHYDCRFRYSKPRNIWEKTKMAALLCDRFIFANDDHFLLRPWENRYYHEGPITHFKITGGSTFSRYVQNTAQRFPGGNYFDVHTPMEIKSDLFLPIDYGAKDVLLKSTYCNTLGIVGEFTRDCKINSKMTYIEIAARVQGLPCFSIGDAGFTSTMRKFLLDIFPDPSKFEQ